MGPERVYRAGESIEDYCRACKTDRMHVVVAADSAGRPIRVSCGYCRSEHNYRGGPRIETSTSTIATTGTAGTTSTRSPASASPEARRLPVSRDALPIVSERERSAPPIMVSSESADDLEMLLRRIIREETGITAVAPAEKWRGGTMTLKPGTPGLQEKSWPIETFFHKVVMLRNRLRTLEQQVNASDLPDDVKVKLQSYVSGCYGSLTSFNVLFAEEGDQFKGSGE
jgi:hypothetical protein